MMMRRKWMGLVLLALVMLLPEICGAWGTLTAPLPMTDTEIGQLNTLIASYGARPGAQDEIEPRRGPHPTHQFIVQQAYLLLANDPASKGGPWQLPKLESVLAWDGIVRVVGRRDGMNGMWERAEGGTDFAAGLALPKGEVGGPSADAELALGRDPRGGVFPDWNSDYNGAYHYYNPWLKCGQAPKAAGDCYADLVRAVTNSGSENARAKAASHLAHYLSDAICPKHADMVELDERTLDNLAADAHGWFAELQYHPTLATWLTSTTLTHAVNTILQASGQRRDSPYWRRVESHIGENSLLGPNEAWSRVTADVARPSLRTAVGAFLAALRDRPPRKDLTPFYDFFDPFYYNGPLVMLYKGAGLLPESREQFGLATPASEHLMWETNPALGRYLRGRMQHPQDSVRGTDVGNSYAALPVRPDLWEAEDTKREAAYREAMAEFVRGASRLQHGNDPQKGDDFNNAIEEERDSFEAPLSLSIKYVFSALRASITALRAEASYAFFPEEKLYRVYCDLGNVAEEAAQIKAIRVSVIRNGETTTYPEWAKTVSCSVAKGGRQRVVVELPQGEALKETAPQFAVEVFGRYEKTPDLGYWRGEASQKMGRIIHGMSLPVFDRVKGPLDLVICFDVTNSMSSSINSVRDNAIEVLGKLRERLTDLRVALISFRDIKEDKDDCFTQQGFSTDIKDVVATMKGWKARGGGDDPEDQLEAIRMGLDLWGIGKKDPRNPTKIVVVITDAAPHDPDSKGNTQESIAKYARDVDPAHIYTILVGSSAEARAKSESLAKLTGGEVLTAASGEQVASVLLSAVERAVATHGGPAGPRLPPWLLFYGGLAGVVLGGWWLRWGRGRRGASAG